MPNGGRQPTIIKKYANRRLYHTGTSTYVTLEDLARMVKDGEDFVVTDAKTGEDITRAVLGQIIFEQEGRGQHLLPIAFLRQLIRFYGDQMQTLLPTYLESSLSAFTRNQDKLREQMARALKGDALGRDRGADAPQHGDVLRGDADVDAVCAPAARTASTAPAEFHGAAKNAKPDGREEEIDVAPPPARRDAEDARDDRRPQVAAIALDCLQRDVARGGADRHREAADEIDQRDRRQDEECAGRRLRNERNSSRKTMKRAVASIGR